MKIKSPKRVVMEGLAAGATGQLLLGALFVAGLKMGQPKAVTLAGWMLIGWPFLAVSATIVEARNAWLREPHRGGIEDAIPAAIVIALLATALLVGGCSR